MSSTSAATGFCRVTVVAPDSRIDVALPDDIAVADVYPEILRLTGQTQPVGTPTGYHLVRRDGTVLDGARTLAAHRVLDGELLSLRPFAESLPPAVHDDVTDAVADAVTRDRALWDDGLLRMAGLFGGPLLLALMGLALWFADPVRHDMSGVPGAVAAAVGVLLTALAAVRARVYDDRGSAVALGLAALPHLMIAGSGIVAPGAGESAGRLQFLLGCAAVLVASAVLVAAVPTGDAPFVAAVTAAATGTLAAFGTILADTAPTGAAAVCAVLAIGAIAFLPGLSARVARLPIGYAAPRSATGADPDASAAGRADDPIDAERIAARVRRGHELLLGLVGGCAAVVTVASAVLAFSDDGRPWARLLALVAGLTMLLRARLFRYTAQVTTVLGAGLAALALLVLGMAVNTPAAAAGGSQDIRTLWLAAAVTVGGGLLTAVALIVPRKGLSPFWGRASDIAESALLLALVPLCLAVLDMYGTARGLSAG
ncbi:type VII secretion integral membrane protein EccD [Streptomyces sp. UNOC14_S4]|uniref:type VII secretion integral membrane protein EccD n=1 Tax=Streptomyces sp. UNOC14_S4 TaxID=2872340 RepID=UPI001E4D7C00|nr:type VII secretion integral membrane protein EccD [Streptomyces sp. UNOC14_S4]MCC3766632.1 type VII secretion integral membrane protein EccD [Streptomyces sp. UNOC14_S4]